MKLRELGGDFARTYLSLRQLLVAVGVALPPLLWLGYFLATGSPELQDSMSAYYHAGGGVMRAWFVGSLFAVAALLFAYHGFTWLEDWALNVASVFAVGIAVFPMSWPKGSDPSPMSLHGACAVLFFACIAYVCIFQASATLVLIDDETKRRRYRLVYKLLGALMILSPVIATVFSAITAMQSSLVFFIEAAGVWVFALYWRVKTREIATTQADLRAARGSLKRPNARMRDAFRELSVTAQNPGDLHE